MSASKPVEGHKFERIRYMAQAVCGCGWESGRWVGKGARGQAYAEWRGHVERCDKASS